VPEHVVFGSRNDEHVYAVAAAVRLRHWRDRHRMSAPRDPGVVAPDTTYPVSALDASSLSLRDGTRGDDDGRDREQLVLCRTTEMRRSLVYVPGAQQVAPPHARIASG